MLSRLPRSLNALSSLKSRINSTGNKLQTNLVPKRWSHYNHMTVEPSNYDWKKLKDTLHFWSIIAATPLIVVTTIVNIRSNYELTEIPEGYEPREWEYYRHPITRFIAKHMVMPLELEHEMKLSLLEKVSESLIIDQIINRVDRCMKFYTDSRAKYFVPYFGDYFRRGRDIEHGVQTRVQATENVFYEAAFDPKEIHSVPIEGFRDPVD